MKKKLSIFLFFVLVIGCFYLFNYSMSVFFENKYIDLSGNNKYSLSSASKKIISELNATQSIKIYISPQIAKDYPQTAEYGKYIAELVKQYEKENPKKITAEIIEIEPFGPQEHEAEQYGLKSFASKDGKISLYLGGVITNEQGQYIAIPNFVELRSPYLEYDITSAIKQLSQPQKMPKIGVIAPDLDTKVNKDGSLDLSNNLNIFNQLKNKYQLVPISDYSVQIGVDINTVILINPNEGLSNIGQYALDQFILRGGNLIVFVDAIDEKNNKINNEKAINNLLNNWGIDYSSKNTIGSKDKAIEVISGSKRFSYMPWMNLSSESFNQENDLTQGLNSISLRSPAAINAKKGKAEEFSFTPLITISGKTGTIESSVAKQTYKEISAANFTETNKDYIIAAEVEGKFRSIFQDNIMKGTKYENQMLSFLPQSMKKGKIFIIADIDFLYDSTWSDNSYKNKNTTYGFVPWSENGLLLERILNKINGNEELVALKIQSNLPQDSLGTKFKQEAEKNFLQEKEQKQQDLKASIAKAERMNFQNYSMGNMQQINRLQEEITTAEKAIRQLDYQAEQAYKKKMNIFMGASAGAMLLYAAIIALIFRKRLKHRRSYKEKSDE